MSIFRLFEFSVTVYVILLDVSSRGFGPNHSGCGSTTVTLFNSQPFTSSPDLMCSVEDAPGKAWDTVEDLTENV